LILKLVYNARVLLDSINQVHCVLVLRPHPHKLVTHVPEELLGLVALEDTERDPSVLGQD